MRTPEVALTASTESLLFSRAMRTVILQTQNQQQLTGEQQHSATTAEGTYVRIKQRTDLCTDLPTFKSKIKAYIENTPVIPQQHVTQTLKFQNKSTF